MELSDCLLGEGLVARDATLPFLGLSGCRLEHPAQPPLSADRLTAAVLSLDQAAITANCEPGAVGLVGAHLGRLDCTDATMRNDAGPALDADDLQVDRNVFLRGRSFQAVGAGKRGAVRLRSAHLGGQLDCTDATMCNDAGPDLDAYGLQVDQSVFFRRGFEAVGGGNGVTLNLREMRIGGELTFAPKRLEHTAAQNRLDLVDRS